MSASLIDTGNELVGPGPAQITVGQLPPEIPAPPAVVLTIRTPSTTLTVMLDKESAQGWGALISAEAAKLSDSGLVVASTAQAMRTP